MASNIEIKARVHDFPHIKELAQQISKTRGELLDQEDTFFQCSTGRLKLRMFNVNVGELIYYERADTDIPKQSNYIITPTSNPAALKATLSSVLGIKGVVRKQRVLHLFGQIRIHIDNVEALGHFVELEFVMLPGQDPSIGLKNVKDLMEKLEIRSADLVKEAYLDLLGQTYSHVKQNDSWNTAKNCGEYGCIT